MVVVEVMVDVMVVVVVSVVTVVSVLLVVVHVPHIIGQSSRILDANADNSSVYPLSAEEELCTQKSGVRLRQPSLSGFPLQVAIVVVVVDVAVVVVAVTVVVVVAVVVVVVVVVGVVVVAVVVVVVVHDWQCTGQYSFHCTPTQSSKQRDRGREPDTRVEASE